MWYQNIKNFPLSIRPFGVWESSLEQKWTLIRFPRKNPIIHSIQCQGTAKYAIQCHEIEWHAVVWHWMAGSSPALNGIKNPGNFFGSKGRNFSRFGRYFRPKTEPAQAINLQPAVNTWSKPLCCFSVLVQTCTNSINCGDARPKQNWQNFNPVRRVIVNNTSRATECTHEISDITYSKLLLRWKLI